MSRYSKTGKLAKAGSYDSKYFNASEAFENNIKNKCIKTEMFKKYIRDEIIKDPNLIELRYFNVIEVLKEIKDEFKI